MAPWPRIGGALCLDFCNTLSWRLTPEPVDRLRSHADLLDWAGLPPGPDDPEALARALELRAATISAFEGGDVDPIRLAYARALGDADVRMEHGTPVLEWPGDPLAPVVHSAWAL